MALHLPICVLKPALGWSRYRDVIPVPTRTLSNNIATAPSGPVTTIFKYERNSSSERKKTYQNFPLSSGLHRKEISPFFQLRAKSKRMILKKKKKKKKKKESQKKMKNEKKKYIYLPVDRTNY